MIIMGTRDCCVIQLKRQTEGEEPNIILYQLISNLSNSNLKQLNRKKNNSNVKQLEI